MGWTIATYAFRLIALLSIAVLVPFIYLCVKELLTTDKTKCRNCERVSIEVWACHSDRKYCINCCGCPDHQDTVHPYRHCSTAPGNTWCGNCAEID